MFCDQCPEVLSGKDCTKNGPCKKHRVELPKTESQGKESDLGLPARLKAIRGFFKKKTLKRHFKKALKEEIKPVKEFLTAFPVTNLFSDIFFDTDTHLETVCYI